MPAPIDFWFDFSSPYAYLASERIEALAARHGRSVQWKPFLLGAVLKLAGGTPLTEGYPPKARYSIHDFARSARYHGVPFRMPTVFPIASITAARAVLWLQRTDPARVAPFVHAIFRALFTQDRNVSEAAVVAAVAQEVGIDPAALAAGVADPAIKDALKADVEAAIALGVFGAPTLVVDGEMFWGHDRLDQLERWLADGGF